jgi:hypothetical protein
MKADPRSNVSTKEMMLRWIAEFLLPLVSAYARLGIVTWLAVVCSELQVSIFQMRIVRLVAQLLPRSLFLTCTFYIVAQTQPD